jgi:hypothetical protein
VSIGVVRIYWSDKETKLKRSVFSALCACAIVLLSIAPTLADPPSLTGNWNIEQTGANGGSTGTVVLKQSGNSIVGSNAKTGNGFTGDFVNDTQINGKWHGPGGAGWLTIYATPNGHSFNGTWGYNGRAANGSFVGNKFLPPSEITAAGAWNITLAGGPTTFSGPMTCTQSGPSVLCKVQQISINGKFRTKDKVRATWTGPSKKGWFSFWFNGDNNSFNGQWGYGADTTPPVGRVVGQRKL